MKTGHAVAEPAAGAIAARREIPGWKRNAIALGVIAVCFALYAARPYSLVSDLGFQAFSAKQFAEGHAPEFNTIRLASARDLSRDVTGHLTLWSPAWTALFAAAFEAGLSPGHAARLLAVILCVIGALGWVRITRAIGLAGCWQVAGIVLSALYCLRSYAVTLLGTGDAIMYAVAPWLILAGLKLSVPLAAPGRGRLVARTALFCLALGAVYWLKFTGIFLGAAVFLAVAGEQMQWRIGRRFPSALAILVLYGAMFAAAPLALKVWTYRTTGSDYLESAATKSPKRDAKRLLQFLPEAAWYASTVLFSADTGPEKIVKSQFSPAGWMIRLPGLAMLALFFALGLARPPGYLRNIALLAVAIPLVALPLLSFAAGPHFSKAMDRACGPYWIVAELLILLVISQKRDAGVLRSARMCLAGAVALQLVFLMAVMVADARESWYIMHSPAHLYETSTAGLWDTDLSKFGTRDIVANVRSLARGPRDVIVPAIYTDRSFGSDTLLELGGRLLPLGPRFPLLAQTYGSYATDYYATEPLRSSQPLRVILVATDVYNEPAFNGWVRNIMRRFDQIRAWTPGPPDPHGRTHIWVGEIP